MSYVNSLSNWYRKSKNSSTLSLETNATISQNIDSAIDLVIRHNKKRCERYWSAKSRAIREETLVPLVGLAFKVVGGNTKSENLRHLIKQKLEKKRPNSNVVSMEE